MSLDLSGQNTRITSSYIQIHLPFDHPLLKLGNALPWRFLISLAVEDLKSSTAKRFWWLVRKIKVREHLAAYFLQKLYDLTDRETEYGIKDNVNLPESTPSKLAKSYLSMPSKSLASRKAKPPKTRNLAEYSNLLGIKGNFLFVKIEAHLVCK